MIIYFKNRDGLLKDIGMFFVTDTDTDNDTFKMACDVISEFCKERNYTIPYYRSWNVDYKGTLMTKVDVGSHSEFFYLNPAINLTEK